MKISTKLSGGYYLITGMMIICVIVGLVGVTKLSSSLNLVTGDIWQTSENASQSSRGVLGQMLSVERILNNNILDEKANETYTAQTRKAIAGLKNNTLLDAKSLKDIEQTQADFLQSKADILKQYEAYTQAGALLDRSFDTLNALLTQAKADTALELRKALTKASGRGGNLSDLGRQWALADLAKENQLYLLEVRYLYQSVVTNTGKAKSEDLEMALLSLQELLQEVVADSFFESRLVAEGEYSGESFSEALTAAYTQLEADVWKSVNLGKKLSASQAQYSDLSLKLVELMQSSETYINDLVQQQLDDINGTRSVLVALLVFSALVALAISIWIILKVVNVMVAWLVQTQESMTELARGHLTAAKNQRDFADAGEDVQAIDNAIVLLVNKFSDVVSEIVNNTAMVNDISKQIATAANGISQGANEQAASVEETSASIEQMSATVSQNNQNATRTKDIAIEAANSAREGNNAVLNMVEAMRNIAEKVSVIDDIAYQTNLLALNASIEASRAGDDGRGFAVVAAEVRKLAERSKVAASEVIEMANETVSVSDKAGQQLTEVLPSIEKTSELVQEISAASAEQASGLHEITFAISQLDQVAQHNASSSLQLTEMASNMDESIAKLEQVVKFFEISNNP